MTNAPMTPTAIDEFERGRMVEREKIVAWLRRKAEGRRGWNQAYLRCADIFEAGDH